MLLGSFYSSLYLKLQGYLQLILQNIINPCSNICLLTEPVLLFIVKIHHLNRIVQGVDFQALLGLEEKRLERDLKEVLQTEGQLSSKAHA